MPHRAEEVGTKNGPTAHGAVEEEYARQSRRLAQFTPSQEDDSTGSTQAVTAKFVTAHDPVIETANGGRLPAIPVDEAVKLNNLKEQANGREPQSPPPLPAVREAIDGSLRGPRMQKDIDSWRRNDTTDAPLDQALPLSRTNPLFPPLPMYGPPSLLRTVQVLFFRVSSAILSLGFLVVITLGAAVHLVPKGVNRVVKLITFQDPFKRRPFWPEEQRRARARRAAERDWALRTQAKDRSVNGNEKLTNTDDDEFIPTEGGPDPLVCDVGYYARRVGLDAEIFEVQTEDGFIIELWHLFNPLERNENSKYHHAQQGPAVFRTKRSDSIYGEAQRHLPEGRKKYPVLMMHGLLQSAGAYCCNDDASLAFFLAKSGYDVWLGNNRCGFNPKHVSLTYDDPRMWAWNIRQMGVMDLPALISRVLAETGFPKLALIAHSQGTTQTLVALAKEQRPEFGEKISVFCALAPAAYAGPLIGKIYFKVMRLVPPSWFRLIFGIHAFCPIMMEAHKYFPGKLYGGIGYRVFSYLFDWTDHRWERDLRGRMFQFAPVYVSAESMRWWLGRECFAKQRCILATRKEGRMEDKEDEEDDEVIRRHYDEREKKDRVEGVSARRRLVRNISSFHCLLPEHQHHDSTRGKYAWYDKRFPPLALWVCGADDLVDGRRLLRRFERGREPHVRIVHKKIIEGYEHLDVIWAVDMIEKVGNEIREIIWRTADEESKKVCRTPTGCEGSMQTEEEVVQHERRASFSSDISSAAHSGYGRSRAGTLTSIAEGATASFKTNTKSTLEEDEDYDDGDEIKEDGDGDPDTQKSQSPTIVDATRGATLDERIHEKTYRHRRESDLPAFTDLEEKENPLG